MEGVTFATFGFLVLGLVVKGLFQVAAARSTNKSVTPVTYYSEHGWETAKEVAVAISVYLLLPGLVDLLGGLLSGVLPADMNLTLERTPATCWVLGILSGLLTDVIGKRFNLIALPGVK